MGTPTTVPQGKVVFKGFKTLDAWRCQSAPNFEPLMWGPQAKEITPVRWVPLAISVSEARRWMDLLRGFICGSPPAFQLSGLCVAEELLAFGIPEISYNSIDSGCKIFTLHCLLRLMRLKGEGVSCCLSKCGYFISRLDVINNLIFRELR